MILHDPGKLFDYYGLRCYNSNIFSFLARSLAVAMTTAFYAILGCNRVDPDATELWRKLKPPTLSRQQWNETFRVYMNQQVHHDLMYGRGGHPTEDLSRSACWDVMVRKSSAYLFDAGSLVSVIMYFMCSYTTNTGTTSGSLVYRTFWHAGQRHKNTNFRCVLRSFFSLLG